MSVAIAGINGLGLAPTFGKGIGVIVAALVLFVGSVYMLLGATFGLRMGYLVLAVSFFGWMLVLSTLWAFGAPGTLRDLGPRGVEAHWQVFAAGTGTVSSAYPPTKTYPALPWHQPDAISQPSVDTVKTVMQSYLAQQAQGELKADGSSFTVVPTDFVVQNVLFATGSDGTHLVAGQGFYSPGGPTVTMFASHQKGNVPIYSWLFFFGSLAGFAIHIPYLNRAERTRKEILTGGTAPPWYGPA